MKDDIREFLTGETPEEGVTRLNNEFLERLPELRKELGKVFTTEKLEVEVRTIQLTMPPSFWAIADKFTELFEITNAEESLEDASAQKKIFGALDPEGKLSTQEVLFSQALIDTLLLFTSDIAKTELLYRLQKAINDNDTEGLMKIVQRMKDENMGSNPEPPQDDNAN